jgi:hypothetical protein
MAPPETAQQIMDKNTDPAAAETARTTDSPAVDPSTACCVSLTRTDRLAIAEILSRRANDIATFKWDLEKAGGAKIDAFPGSVEMALSREMKRLRRLSDLVKPPAEPQEDDEE